MAKGFCPRGTTNYGAMIDQQAPVVKGSTVDAFTRCLHYHSPLDVVAIKFKCCDEYYACFSCHEEVADHPHQVWTKNEFQEKAILCGACKTEMTIRQYLDASNHCPNCQTAFNPNCSKHYHLYFDI